MRRVWFSLNIKQFPSTAVQKDEDAQFDWQPTTETLKRLAFSFSSPFVNLYGKADQQDDQQIDCVTNSQPAEDPAAGVVADAPNNIEDEGELNIESVQGYSEPTETTDATSSVEFCSTKTGLPYFLSEEQIELLNRSREVLTLLEKQKKSEAKKNRRRKRVIVACNKKFKMSVLANRKMLRKVRRTRITKTATCVKTLPTLDSEVEAPQTAETQNRLGENLLLLKQCEELAAVKNSSAHLIEEAPEKVHNFFESNTETREDDAVQG